MTRIPTVRTLALAIAGLLLTALPALAQDPGAAPAAGATPPGAVSSTVSALSAPKGPDDMTGSLGFGVGVIPNAQLAGTNGQVAVKYWMRDTLAIVPALNFNITKATGTDTSWVLNPEVVALFVPFKSTSTRLLVGGGLGLSVGKAPPVTAMTDTTFHVYLPIQAGVEHFFTRWFSTGIAARTNLFDYTKTGTPYSMSIAINSAALLGSLFFYTD
jgi:hypothetical protein